MGCLQLQTARGKKGGAREGKGKTFRSTRGERFGPRPMTPASKEAPARGWALVRPGGHARPKYPTKCLTKCPTEMSDQMFDQMSDRNVRPKYPTKCPTKYSTKCPTEMSDPNVRPNV